MENIKTSIGLSSIFKKIINVASTAFRLVENNPRVGTEEFVVVGIDGYEELVKSLEEVKSLTSEVSITPAAESLFINAVDDRSVPVPSGEFEIDGELHMRDAQNRLCPISTVRAIDQLRDMVVRTQIGKAKALNAAIRKFKEDTFAEIIAFMQVSAEQHGIKWGGEKGNVTLMTHCGTYKLNFAISEKIAFDEGFQNAKKLVEECIGEWNSESRPEIKMLVQQAFAPDGEGKININRILALRRVEIKHDKWQLAMKLVGQSIMVVGSKRYVRFYERKAGTDEFISIPLDVAGV